MPSLEQYHEYAVTVLAFLERGQKKMSRKQKDGLQKVKDGIETMRLAGLPDAVKQDESVAPKVEKGWQDRNKELADLVIRHLKPALHAQAKKFLIDNLLASTDTPEDVKRKLDDVRLYTGVRTQPVAKKQEPAQKIQTEETRKIIVIGDTQIGKTALLKRYVHGISTPTKPTIGVDFSEKTIQVGSTKLHQQLWDVSGQEKDIVMMGTYLSGAQGIVLAYDTTKASTFHNLTSWITQLNAKFQEKLPPIVLVGTKADLRNQKEVPSQSAKAFAEEQGWEFIETSAKDNSDVDLVFNTLAHRVLNPEGKAEVKKSLTNTELANLLRDKAWHSVTSFGAGTPAGFLQILTAIKKKSDLPEADLMAAIHDVAKTRSQSTVLRRFFPNGTRDPLLIGVYQDLLKTKSLVDVEATLQKGLENIQSEQFVLKMMR